MTTNIGIIVVVISVGVAVGIMAGVTAGLLYLIGAAISQYHFRFT